MAEQITQARPYATAAFELAEASDSLAQWSAMLRVLDLVVSDPQLKNILHDPRVNAGTLSGIFLDVSAGYLTADGGNFIRMLVDAGRISLIPYIYRLFEERRRTAEGIVEVEVASAYPLNDAERDRIAREVEQRYRKKVTLNTRIDETLIGGAVIRVGDSVIDISVRGRLRQLGNQLAE